MDAIELYDVPAPGSEGFDVAERLAAHGIAAFVLTYRLVPCEQDAVAEMTRKAGEDLDAMLTDMLAVADLAASRTERPAAQVAAATCR